MKSRSHFFFCLSFVFSIFSVGVVHGKTISIQKEERIDSPLSEIKEVILDIDNTCASGCRYELSHIQEIKLAEKISDNHFFTWIYVNNIKDSMDFTENKVTTLRSGEVQIKSGQPSSEKIKQLREKTGFPYKTLGGTSESTWILREKFDVKGKFIGTLVKYHASATSSSPLLSVFGSVVRGVMNKTANQMFENIKQ